MGKTKFGGVNFGLIVSYHSESVTGDVNKLPRKATKYTISKEKTKTFQFIFFILYYLTCSQNFNKGFDI